MISAMPPLGQRLRQEREARGISLPEIAAATKIGRHYLEAIEEGEFDRLPGDVFNRGFVSAYAAQLGLDVDAAVEEYRRERSEADGLDDGESTSVVPEMARLLGADRERVERTRMLHRVLVLVGMATLATGAATVIWLSSSRDPVSASAARGIEAVSEIPVRQEVQSNAPPPVAVDRSRDPIPEPATSKPPIETGSALSVTRHGVGTGMEDRELVGQSDRFTAGQRVWFWNLIEGGARGDSIEHLWFHGGTTVHRITLPVGAARWRTQSQKTIRDCDDKEWAVEARDTEGRVLARSTFSCRP